jgi:hypothetical protein
MKGDEMKKDKPIRAREAKLGERTIELKIRFWTDGISREPGKQIVPKHAWTSGVVGMKTNEAHGIIPTKAKTFNSLLDLGAAIERTLKDNGIVLHKSRGMRKYVA